MRFVVWLLLAFLAAEASAVACPHMSIRDRVATPEGVDVYAGGGVIVTVEYSYDTGPNHEVVADGAKLASASYIASGLTVYAPPAGATEINVQAGGETVRKLAVVAAPDLLAAPKLKMVTSNATKPKPVHIAPSRSIPETTTIVTLAARPPDDAFALVAYDRRGKDAFPRAWAVVEKGVSTYTFRTGGKPCERLTAGPTFAGDHLRFVWLDRGGRLSKSTPMLRVGKTR